MLIRKFKKPIVIYFCTTLTFFAFDFPKTFQYSLETYLIILKQQKCARSITFDQMVEMLKTQNENTFNWKYRSKNLKKLALEIFLETCKVVVYFVDGETPKVVVCLSMESQEVHLCRFYRRCLMFIFHRCANLRKRPV